MSNLVIGGPYEAHKDGGTMKLNKVYSRTWRAPYVNGVTMAWARRTHEYWERVEQRFGVVMSGHRNAYDEMTGTISTFATVLAVLKGDRYPHRQSEEVH